MKDTMFLNIDKKLIITFVKIALLGGGRGGIAQTNAAHKRSPPLSYPKALVHP